MEPDTVLGDHLTLERVQVADVPAHYKSSLDLLFVVDNSVGTSGKQDELAASFARLSEYLEFHTLEPDQALELNIGVVSTDMGVGAEHAEAIAGCTATGDGGALLTEHARDVFLDPGGTRFLEHDLIGAEVVHRNYRGELSDAFARLSKLGSGGCRFEQPLAAAKAAIAANRRGGYGAFSRSEALAVVFVSTEDDCSVRDPSFFDPALGGRDGGDKFACFEAGVVCDYPDDVWVPGEVAGNCTVREDSPYMTGAAEYAEFLQQRWDRDAIVVAAMIGDSDVVRIAGGADKSPQVASYRCDGEQASYAAVRLDSFVGEFHDSGAVSPLCGERAADALTDTARKIRHSLGTACLTRPIHDFDPDTFAVDNDCEVHVRYPDGSREYIPECPAPRSRREDSAQVPCYVIDRGGEACGDFYQQSLDVWWGWDDTGVAERAQPAGSRVIAECLVAP